MKVPILSLYSLSLSIIALAYLIPSLLKIFSKAKIVDHTLEIKTEPIDRLKKYKKEVDKNKFGIKILKILRGTNELKIFFVNTGEKLFKPICDCPSSKKTTLEIESTDRDIDNRETGVILISGYDNNANNFELLFEYQTELQIHKKKKISIDVEKNIVEILE